MQIPIIQPETVLMWAQIFGIAGVALVVDMLARDNSRLRRINTELKREVQTTEPPTVVPINIDPLTGLHNRAVLTELLENGVGVTGVAAVLDVDEFKEINDSFGHLAGDEVLQGIGGLIRGSIRERDFACRWGGDEFVIFFKNECREAAQKRLARIEHRLAGFHLRQYGGRRVSVSWGMAEVHEDSLKTALEAADNKMYQMKRRRKMISSGLVRSKLQVVNA
jgi:diguanylate cyclase (GGDEF)-like protein